MSPLHRWGTWFVGITGAVALATIAAGVSYLTTVRVSLLLLLAGFLFRDGTGKQPLGLRYFSVCVALSSLALSWVLMVTTDLWLLKAMIFAMWAVAMISLHKVHRELSSRAERYTNNKYDFTALSIAAPLVLVVHGWTHIIPLAISVLVTTLGLKVMRGRGNRLLIGSIFVIFNCVGVLASRQWLAREDIRVFLSYDQTYRASLATGLTRWGWTDWNAAAGQPVRYHWLSEATAGLLSRLTGIDEFDSVVRLIPVLGIVGALLVGATLLQNLGATPFAAWAATTLTVGLQMPFSVFSIGTMWGSFLGLGVLTTVVLINSGSGKIRISVAHVIAVSVNCLVVLMSQSSVGLTIALVVGTVYCALLFQGRVRPLGVLGLGVALICVYVLVGQTLLRSPANTYFHVKRIHFLHHGIIGLPESFKLAFSPWVEPYSQSLLVPMFIASVALGSSTMRSTGKYLALFIVGAYSLSALSIINLIRIGGHEERFVRETLVVASLFGLGGLISVISMSRTPLHRVLFGGLFAITALGSGLFWQTERSAETYVWVHVSVTLALIVLAVAVQGPPKLNMTFLIGGAVLAGTIVGFFHESAEQSLSIARRELPELASVNGNNDVDECLDWVRSSTSVDSIVASNMWRIPNGDDQKYFLVSLKTKRRVILDGPDYVRNVGAFSGAEEIEGLKNVIDDFVYSPTIARLYRLRALGAKVIVIDLRRHHSSRLDRFGGVPIKNHSCMVLTISSDQ